MLINESSFAPPSKDETERVDTVKQDVKFVNSLLSQCGLEAPFPFSRVVADPVTPSDLYHLETATKILISLLNSKQRENAFRAELDDRQRRLGEELDSREIVISKYHSKLESSEKELRSTQQQLYEAQNRIIQLERLAQGATEEANRIKSAFTIKEKQFNNDLRKREIEFDKLREQLQNCLREPAAVIATHSRAENTFDFRALRVSLPRTSTNTSMEEGGESSSGEGEGGEAPEEQLDRLELMEHENANMRQLLASINQILAEMRAATLHLTAAEGEEEELLEGRDLTNHINTLPIAWIYEHAKEEIETSLAVISDFIRSQ